MTPKTETRHTYGLRDPRSGEFVRIEMADPNESDSERATLTLTDYGPTTPRLSMPSLSGLLTAAKENTPWYNATKERPKWGDVDVPTMIPVRFTEVLDFDGAGTEPISTSTSAQVVILPEVFPGETVPARSDAPEFIMNGIFGGDWPDHLAPEEREPAVLIADTSSAPIEPGMIVYDHYGIARQAAVVVPVPKDWPKLPSQTDAIDGSSMRLVLTTTDVRADVRPFLAADFLPDAPTHRM